MALAASGLPCRTGSKTTLAYKLSPALTSLVRLHARQAKVLRTRAVETEERSKNDSAHQDNGAPKSVDEANDQLQKRFDYQLTNVPKEQQKAISDLYMYLVQHPNAEFRIKSFNQLQQAFDEYQVLVWRPAELLNGRMAMLGFIAGVGCEVLTGASVWTQLNYAPYSYLAAFALVLAAAALNRQYGSPQEGIGPFTRQAELLNGRAAMFGYALLAWIEYNHDIRRSAFLFAQTLSRVQGQTPHV